MDNKWKVKQFEASSIGSLRIKKMIGMNRGRRRELASGFTMVELLIVLALIGFLTAIAVPALTSQRRLIRSIGVTREIATQLRYTRQLAMSERKAFTFSYDNATKQITIIDHNNLRTDPNSGKAVLALANYPNTAGSTVVSTTSLGQAGLNTAELIYGIPTSLPSTAQGGLSDGVSMTVLVGNKLNITFQRDGSVIDSTGSASDRNAQDQALFIYNSKVPAATASAISVLGASGRIKIWRYDNATKYAE
jgi:prepilin-type N-terminal cleavage/methylation domain-containing protein